MSSTSEVGHANNVANFQDLIAFVVGYGATYNPARDSLKLPQLNALYAQANNALSNVIHKNSSYIVVVNHRVEAFKDLRPLSTRIVNALDAAGASAEIIKDARTINRKIYGKPAPNKQKSQSANQSTPKRISSAQLSYDQLVQHLQALISLLEATPDYTINESDLSIPALKAKLQDMIAKNEQVSAPHTNLSNARLERDKVLYHKETGLYTIALEVKKYVKSVYGAASPEFRLINSIKFKPRKVS